MGTVSRRDTTCASAQATSSAPSVMHRAVQQHRALDRCQPVRIEGQQHPADQLGLGGGIRGAERHGLVARRAHARAHLALEQVALSAPRATGGVTPAVPGHVNFRRLARSRQHGAIGIEEQRGDRRARAPEVARGQALQRLAVGDQQRELAGVGEVARLAFPARLQLGAGIAHAQAGEPRAQAQRRKQHRHQDHQQRDRTDTEFHCRCCCGSVRGRA
jgi:hypothetical protein